MTTREMCGNSVPLLGFGCMRFPTLEGGGIDRPAAREMIDFAYQNGVNYFDTAYAYHDGESEPFLGEALRDYPRESLYIADKYPTWITGDENRVREVFEEQLRRLQVEYIDYYLLHSLDRSHLQNARKMKLYDYFRREQEKGRIRHLGFSFHDTPELLRDIVGEHDYDFAQIQMNYLDWSYMRSEEFYNILTERNIPVIVMEPVRGGFLANPMPAVNEMFARRCPGVTPASLALRWAAQFENVRTVLSGMSSMDQVRENVGIFSRYTPLSESENEAANEAIGIISETRTIPCTGCRYCMDCPSGVDIPGIFNMYNHYKAVNDGFRTGMTYGYIPREQKPESCIECGACSPMCPQHIDIPAALREAAATLSPLVPA